MTIVPPIKSQGIKTKLVSWIKECSTHSPYCRWVEPFMGTGVVAFNIQPKVALLCDSNPHLITFYKSIQEGVITPEKARSYLRLEGEKLLRSEGEHYYYIRERFNQKGNPLDFLFLSRACFNGMMRFNRKGGFNVPFCRKPNRFAQALITKICNQIKNVSQIISYGNYTFKHQDFFETSKGLNEDDIVYCDPPYIGRHVDYFDSWSVEEEIMLQKLLKEAKVRFIVSTWFKNKYRSNDHVFSTWKDYTISTKEHFYHVGGKEKNRNSVTEALLTNFATLYSVKIKEITDRTIDIQTVFSTIQIKQQQALLYEYKV